MVLSFKSIYEVYQTVKKNKRKSLLNIPPQDMQQKTLIQRIGTMTINANIEPVEGTSLVYNESWSRWMIFFKKKSNDIFSKKVIDVFENKPDNDILAPRSGGIDVFETREDIFENPGYQANIFPGDKEIEYHEPTVKNKPLQVADILCHGKFRKNRCHAKVIQRTLELYMKGEDKNMKKKPTAVKPKRVTIKDDLEW